MHLILGRQHQTLAAIDRRRAAKLRAVPIDRIGQLGAGGRVDRAGAHRVKREGACLQIKQKTNQRVRLE